MPPATCGWTWLSCGAISRRTRPGRAGWSLDPAWVTATSRTRNPAEVPLPGVGLAVPGQGAGRAAVGDGDRPDNAGRGLGDRTAVGVALASGPARADRVDQDAVPSQFRGEQPG